MQMVGLALSSIGILVAAAGGIWFLIKVFQDDIKWGFICLLCSPAQIVYLIQNFENVKKPFFLQLAGIAISIVGGVIGGIGAPPAGG